MIPASTALVPRQWHYFSYHTPSTDLQRQRGVCESPLDTRYSGNVGSSTYTTDSRDRNTTVHSAIYTEF